MPTDGWMLRYPNLLPLSGSQNVRAKPLLRRQETAESFSREPDQLRILTSLFLNLGTIFSGIRHCWGLKVSNQLIILMGSMHFTVVIVKNSSRMSFRKKLQCFKLVFKKNWEEEMISKTKFEFALQDS